MRGKLSKKEIAKYGRTNHNVFDWIKKERVVVAEKETVESVEAEEMEIDDMDEELEREERLQRVLGRKKEFQNKKVVGDILEWMLVDVKRYRVTEMM